MSKPIFWKVLHWFIAAVMLSIAVALVNLKLG